MERSQARAYEVFVGIDVGKSSNHVVALLADDEGPFLSEEVDQLEAPIRDVLAQAASRGRTLVTVDQTGAFGRLPVAVAKDMGLDVACLPPRKFEQAAATYGEDKDDERDAFILADCARSAPRLVELVGDRSEALAQVKVLSSCRDDLVLERTRCYNRLHDMIHQVWPGSPRRRSCPCPEARSAQARGRPRPSAPNGGRTRARCGTSRRP